MQRVHGPKFSHFTTNVDPTGIRIDSLRILFFFVILPFHLIGMLFIGDLLIHSISPDIDQLNKRAAGLVIPGPTSVELASQIRKMCLASLLASEYFFIVYFTNFIQDPTFPLFCGCMKIIQLA